MKFQINPDGSGVYDTVDGDMVDEIAWAFYGPHRHMTEEVFAANPGLADGPVRLPAGVKVSLPPPPPVVQPIETIRLWD